MNHLMNHVRSLRTKRTLISLLAIGLVAFSAYIASDSGTNLQETLTVAEESRKTELIILPFFPKEEIISQMIPPRRQLKKREQLRKPPPQKRKRGATKGAKRRRQPPPSKTTERARVKQSPAKKPKTRVDPKVELLNELRGKEQKVARKSKKDDHALFGKEERARTSMIDEGTDDYDDKVAYDEETVEYDEEAVEYDEAYTEESYYEGDDYYEEEENEGRRHKHHPRNLL